MGNRLPSAPRERKPALAALAVLLILGGALLSTSLVLSSGDTVSAIGLARDVRPGQQFTGADLKEIKVPKSGGPAYESWTPANVAAVKKLYARVPLLKDSLLLEEQTVQQNFMGPGKVQVGLTLKPGQFPTGLEKGDRVTAYYAGSSDSGSGATRGVLLVEGAWVSEVATGDDESRLSSSGEQQVTLVVEEEDAAKLTPSAAKGDVALVLLPPSGQ
jgi:hypothetical protein